MKKIVIILTAFSLILGGITNLSEAAPPPPPPHNHDRHDKHDKHRMPPPPPPRYIVSQEVTTSESPFAQCIRHFLIEDTTIFHYSDGTDEYHTIYHAVDSEGRYLAKSCASIIHVSHNDIHYLIIRQNYNNYQIINADDENYQFNPEYKSLQLIGENRLLAQNKEGYGIIDFEKNEILPLKYKSLKKLNDRIYRTKLNGYFGIVSSDGNVIIPCNCDKVSSLGKGYYKIKRNNKYGVIDRNGKILATIIYRKVKLERNQLMVTQDGSKWILIHSDL